MTITFDNGDRELVAQYLQQAAIEPTEQRIDTILDSLEADLQKNCYDSEMQYLINETELAL